MPIRNRIQKHNSSRTTIRKARKHNRTSKKSGLRPNIYNPSKYTITQKNKILKLKPKQSLAGGTNNICNSDYGPNYSYNQKVIYQLNKFINDKITEQVKIILNYIRGKRNENKKSEVLAAKPGFFKKFFSFSRKKQTENITATSDDKFTELESFCDEVITKFRDLIKQINTMINQLVQHDKSIISTNINTILTEFNSSNNCIVDFYSKLCGYVDEINGGEELTFPINTNTRCISSNRSNISGTQLYKDLMLYVECVPENKSINNSSLSEQEVLRLQVASNEDLTDDEIQKLLNELLQKLTKIIEKKYGSYNYFKHMKTMNENINKNEEYISLSNELFTDKPCSIATIKKLITKINSPVLLSKSAAIYNQINATIIDKQRIMPPQINDDVKSLYLKRLLAQLLKIYGQYLYSQQNESNSYA